VATFSYRRTNILAISLLCVVVIVSIGGLYFAGNLARFQRAVSIKESQDALQGVNDSSELEQVLKQYPSNRILKIIALANSDSIDIEAATRQLLNEAEPRDLSKPIVQTASSHGDLEALGQDLKMAQSNAATIMPRYTALIEAARDKIERDARSLESGNYTLAKFMALIDEQHMEMTALMPKALAARTEYDGAYEKCVALLLQHFGDTKVVNGQFIFPFQSAADSYNSAATAMTAAAKRMAELEGERTALRQSQLNRWKNFVDR
jgi:hypothetical protein